VPSVAKNLSFIRLGRASQGGYSTNLSAEGGKGTHLFGRGKFVSYIINDRKEGILIVLMGGPCEFLSELGLCAINAEAFFIIKINHGLRGFIYSHREHPLLITCRGRRGHRELL